MPLTKFQSEVLAIIVGNRSEESHFASRLVLNASEETTRFSNNFDMFHDAIVNLDRHSVRDVVALEAAGYEVGKIRARALNPIEMKMEWITISDKA
ncbi:MAG: hypothetical protein H8M99_09800 [Gloeobacteraceae cyanobacterium ES-bin-144]|nr:hypothetical protein [Verrucomicrobiales bacterium]